MFVTLEVSQAEISALNSDAPTNMVLMSVMRETSQWEMGPYVAVAFVESSV